MHSILNLLFEFALLMGAAAATTRISISGVGRRGRIPKSKRGGRNRKEAVLNSFEGAVDDRIDCVYDFVDEGLFRAKPSLAGGRARGGVR